ncbi:hypothetical protein HJG60_009603 [Phyllostomus discolor]|uniref:Uncharacterized protein n=1 Tax=Phyllostomus discolor TaxID=89673 RepID=A0A833YCJ4_9CHIR|nr:hypothetical protein HJG60_009603 [Phyllostomus discolor]
MTSHSLWILRSACPWRNREAQCCAIYHDTLDYVDGFEGRGGLWSSGEDFLHDPQARIFQHFKDPLADQSMRERCPGAQGCPGTGSGPGLQSLLVDQHRRPAKCRVPPPPGRGRESRPLPGAPRLRASCEEATARLPKCLPRHKLLGDTDNSV